MAIEFARVEIASSRGSAGNGGGSAVGLAAHCARQALHSEVLGVTLDPDTFLGTHDPAGAVEMILPEGTPEMSTEALWNKADAAECGKRTLTRFGVRKFRVNAKTCLSGVLVLPNEEECDKRHCMDMARAFVMAKYGQPDAEGNRPAIQLFFHDDPGNKHIHFMVSLRNLNTDGEFVGNIRRDLQADIVTSVNGKTGKKYFKVIKDDFKKQWGNHQVKYFNNHGLEISLDHAGLIPGTHTGTKAQQKSRNNRLRREANRNAVENQDAIRANEEAILASPALIAEKLCEKQSIFTESDLNRYIRKNCLSASEEQKQELKEKVLEFALALVTDKGRKTGFFTSFTVREQEQRILELSDQIALRKAFAIPREIKERIIVGSTLEPDQLKLFDHLTKEKGLAIGIGDAGTGKSFTLARVREAYEAAGFEVRAFAPTNKVVRSLKDDGFASAQTIDKALWFNDKNTPERYARLSSEKKAHWDQFLFKPGQVLIIDEAGMVGAKNYERFLAHAEAKGCKVILVGDDKQLDAIERGGQFTSLHFRHGYRRLTTIKRQKGRTLEEGELQRRASHLLGEGNFKGALRAYQSIGMLHFLENAEHQKQTLLENYFASFERNPDKIRFVYAGTNAEVNEINKLVYEAFRRKNILFRCELAVKTVKGEFNYSVGARIQFHENMKDSNKNVLIANGELGTILSLSEREITVRMDSGEVHAFNPLVFEGHALGYAGTVYRGQGLTQVEVHALHGDTWEKRTSYVGMTRHKEEFHLYCNRDKTRNIDALAQQMSRDRAAGSSMRFLTEQEFEERSSNELGTLHGRVKEAFGNEKQRISERLEGVGKQQGGPTGQKGDRHGRATASNNAEIGRIPEGIQREQRDRNDFERINVQLEHLNASCRRYSEWLAKLGNELAEFQRGYRHTLDHTDAIQCNIGKQQQNIGSASRLEEEAAAINAEQGQTKTLAEQQGLSQGHHVTGATRQEESSVFDPVHSRDQVLARAQADIARGQRAEEVFRAWLKAEAEWKQRKGVWDKTGTLKKMVYQGPGPRPTWDGEEENPYRFAYKKILQPGTVVTGEVRQALGGDALPGYFEVEAKLVPECPELRERIGKEATVAFAPDGRLQIRDHCQPRVPDASATMTTALKPGRGKIPSMHRRKRDGLNR